MGHSNHWSAKRTRLKQAGCDRTGFVHQVLKARTRGVVPFPVMVIRVTTRTFCNSKQIQMIMQILTNTLNLTRQREKDSFLAEIRLRMERSKSDGTVDAEAETKVSHEVTRETGDGGNNAEVKTETSNGVAKRGMIRVKR